MSEELFKSDILALILERPRKFSADEVNYRPAPPGSVMRCAGCINLYRRAIDGFSTCQIMRSEETDDEGVQPNYTCDWYSIDNEVFPRSAEDEPAEPDPEPDDSDIPY